MSSQVATPDDQTVQGDFDLLMEKGFSPWLSEIDFDKAGDMIPLLGASSVPAAVAVMDSQVKTLQTVSLKTATANRLALEVKRSGQPPVSSVITPTIVKSAVAGIKSIPVRKRYWEGCGEKDGFTDDTADVADCIHVIRDASLWEEKQSTGQSVLYVTPNLLHFSALVAGLPKDEDAAKVYVWWVSSCFVLLRLPVGSSKVQVVAGATDAVRSQRLLMDGGALTTEVQSILSGKEPVWSIGGAEVGSSEVMSSLSEAKASLMNVSSALNHIPALQKTYRLIPSAELSRRSVYLALARIVLAVAPSHAACLSEVTETALKRYCTQTLGSIKKDKPASIDKLGTPLAEAYRVLLTYIAGRVEDGVAESLQAGYDAEFGFDSCQD